MPAESRHPLPCHLIDVALVAHVWLAQDEGLLDRFCALWPGVDREEMRRALVATCLVHDAMKCHPQFQSKSDYGWCEGYGKTGVSRPDSHGYDHGGRLARAAVTFAERGVPTGVDSNWLTLVPLLHVAAAHHGTLFDPEDAGLFDIELADDELAWNAVGAVFCEVEALLGGPPPALPPDPPAAFLMLLTGFVSVADWIGSDEYVFEHAPHVTSTDEAKAYRERLHSSGVVERTLERHGLIGRFDTAAFSGAGDLFQALHGFAPYDGFQAQASHSVDENTTGGELVIVEAPMGLGKTEIALVLTVYALLAGTASGLYAALPTQATANALFDRIRTFADRVRSPDSDLALTLAHGARGFYDDYRALVDHSRRLPFERRASYTDADAPPSELVAPSWMQASKRALLAPVGLGTVDQALLGAMGVKHGFVRLFALARKVVVIDEVHSYDVYMGVLLDRLLEWFAALGTTVVLLSATLSQQARVQLLNAYGGATEPSALDPSAYPLMLRARPGEQARATYGDIPDDLKHLRKTVAIERIEAPAGDEMTAAGVRWVLEAARRGGCIVWIRNTVREAQHAWQLLRDAGIDAGLLHSRFVRTDRNAKETTLLDAVGSPKRLENAKTKRPPLSVTVATQIVEQSVDADWDAMLTDLAPGDLLLQRAGRHWRHDRDKDVRHGHPQTLAVLMPTLGERAMLTFGPSAYVYDAETLARTAVLLAEHPTWTLPQTCRTLVADLYDAEWDAERLSCDADALAAVRAKRKREKYAQKRAAKGALVSPPDASIPFVPGQTRRDAGDDSAFVQLGTRWSSIRTAVVVLCRVDEGGAFALGTLARPLTVPSDGDVRARIDAEESVQLSSVSFPWRDDLGTPDLPDALVPFARWWAESHPYDERTFVALDESNEAQLPGAYVSYSSDKGLTVTRSRPDPAPSDPDPFDTD